MCICEETNSKFAQNLATFSACSSWDLHNPPTSIEAHPRRRKRKRRHKLTSEHPTNDVLSPERSCTKSFDSRTNLCLFLFRGTTQPNPCAASASVSRQLSRKQANGFATELPARFAGNGSLVVGGPNKTATAGPPGGHPRTPLSAGVARGAPGSMGPTYVSSAPHNRATTLRRRNFAGKITAREKHFRQTQFYAQRVGLAAHLGLEEPVEDVVLNTCAAQMLCPKKNVLAQRYLLHNHQPTTLHRLQKVENPVKPWSCVLSCVLIPKKFVVLAQHRLPSDHRKALEVCATNVELGKSVFFTPRFVSRSRG